MLHIETSDKSWRIRFHAPVEECISWSTEKRVRKGIMMPIMEALERPTAQSILNIVAWEVKGDESRSIWDQPHEV